MTKKLQYGTMQHSPTRVKLTTILLTTKLQYSQQSDSQNIIVKLNMRRMVSNFTQSK